MPADPNSRTAEPDPCEADESEPADEIAADAYDLEALRKRADVPGLLALAKAYRSGSAPTGRDLKKCLDAYRATAALGNAEAEYAVALFHMNGGTVVAQDLKEGTMRLRSAADKGSVPAKVYLGNLYELGIHYKADPEKADVWYRNAGRTAGVEAEQGSEQWDSALANLGCARHVLALTRKAELDADEKARLLARAKAHGLGLRIRDDALVEGDRTTLVDTLTDADGSPPQAPPRPADVQARKRTNTIPDTKQAKEKAKSMPSPKPVDPVAKAAAEKATKLQSAERKVRLASALGAFGYALLFALAGIGAGYAATLGASELVAHGNLLPLLGTKTRLVFPIVLTLTGVLPAWLVYRFGTVLKALVMGALLAGVGWVAWGTGGGALHSDRSLQALAFGLGGFLAGLLVLGLLGGAKQRRTLPRSRH
jgi:hypothetical protein